MANKKIAIFDSNENYDEVIIKILTENGLRESWEDYFQKIQQNKQPWSDILYALTKNLALDSIEKEFISGAQSQLKVNKMVAERLLKDVKEKLVPLIKIVTVEEIVEETQESIKGHIIQPEKVRKTYQPPSELKIEKKLPEKFITPPKPKSSGQDKYRESLG